MLPANFSLLHQHEDASGFRCLCFRQTKRYASGAKPVAERTIVECGIAHDYTAIRSNRSGEQFREAEPGSLPSSM